MNNKEKILLRHQNISKASEIDILMKEIDQLTIYDKLELSINPDQSAKWLESKSKLIRDIGIKSGIQNKVQIDKIKNKYIGKADTPETQQLLITELLDYFAYLGYPHAELQWESSPAKNSVNYSIFINPRKPCIIEKINYLIPLPKEISLKVSEQDICDIEDIQEKIDLFEKALSEEGYQNSSIHIEKTEYNHDYSKMILTVGGTLGTHVNFEFIDDSGFLITSALDDTTTTYLRKNYSNPFLVRDQIREYYISRGYPYAKIRGPFKQIEDDNAITYIFYVNPGSHYQVYDIIVEGNFIVTTSDIKDNVLKSSFSDFFSTSDTNSTESLKNKIVAYYESLGFWDIRILKYHLDYSNKSGASTLYVTVDEGLQRILKNVTITGNNALKNDEIESLLKTKIGSHVKKDSLSNLEFELKEKYFEKGYLLAVSELTVSSEANDTSTEVSLEIRINEGKIFKIGTINIKGLIDTEERVVRRELKFQSGDIYRQELVENSRTSIQNLGIFNSVSVEYELVPLENSANYEADITINVREGDTGRIKFGPGYNITRGFQYASELSYLNIAGTGRRFTLTGALSQEKQQYSIATQDDKDGKTLLGRKFGANYTEPYIFKLPLSGNVSVYHQAIADDIWKISNSLEFSATHIFNKDYFQGSITPFYRFQLLEDEGTPAQKDSLVTTGFSKIGSVGIRYRLDKRDSLSFPRSGFLFNTELSVADYHLFSQYKYFKWHLSNSYYKELFSKIVFALSTSITSYKDVKRKDSSSENVDVLPANQRLLAGGPNDVRGFHEQLGPYVLIKTNSGSNAEPPLGGSQLLIIKTELRKQIVPDLFSLSLFWDLGNSFFSKDELSTFNKKFSMTNSPTLTRSVEDNFNYPFEQLFVHPEYLFTKNYHSIGVSLGLLTPLGAINASLGWPLLEPKSVNCRVNNVCFNREDKKPAWVQKVKLDFNIGAEF